MEAMRIIGFSPEEMESIHRILAAILHLVSLAWMTWGGNLSSWEPRGGRTGLTAGYFSKVIELPSSPAECELVMHTRGLVESWGPGLCSLRAEP